LPVPSGNTRASIVIDRTRFEVPRARKEDELHIAWIRFYDGRRHLGGVRFTDARVGLDGGVRPGRRLLWQTLSITMPKGLKRITAEVTADKTFDCTMHVDFT